MYICTRWVLASIFNIILVNMLVSVQIMFLIDLTLRYGLVSCSFFFNYLTPFRNIENSHKFSQKLFQKSRKVYRVMWIKWFLWIILVEMFNAIKSPLRIHWRLSAIFKKSNKSIWSNVFWYIKIYSESVFNTLLIQIKRKC